MFTYTSGVNILYFCPAKIPGVKALSPYLQFAKLRLSFLVIISALSGYLFSGGSDLEVIVRLCFGGFLVTAAANGVNQILEKRQDGLMARTSKRPLVTGHISTRQAIFLSVIFLSIGGALLLSINTPSFILGIASFLIYAFIYTPLKGVTSWSVLVGAIPGAIPPMLGSIAHTGEFGFVPGILFFIQFMWQFPHFWSIAWVMHEDYLKAGYFLLPSSTGKTKQTALLISLYSVVLIPVSLIPWLLNYTNLVSLIVVSLLGIWFYVMSFRLYTHCDDASARKLMFASFVYLPVIQFTYVLTKVIH